jgi:hypothetical protein
VKGGCAAFCWGVSDDGWGEWGELDEEMDDDDDEGKDDDDDDEADAEEDEEEGEEDDKYAEARMIEN